MGLPVNCTIVQVEEFPVGKVLQDQLKCPRRTRFIFSMIQEKIQMIYGIILLLLTIPCLFFKTEISINCLILLIVISSPLLPFFWWLTSSCYLSLLSDQLIQSKTPFSESSDSQDIDEFDEDAPPPVKNIKIPSWKVVYEVIKILILGESNGGILRLWDGDVIEALALTSVLCFTDREGPISNVKHAHYLYDNISC